MEGLTQSFPMYVVPVRELLKMTEAKPHHELLQANILVEYYAGSGMVLFTSHQWLAYVPFSGSL